MVYLSIHKQLFSIVSVIDKPDAYLTLKPNTSKEKGDV